jgi:hypothetical protein
METSGINTVLGGRASVYIRVFLKKKRFYAICKKLRKVKVDEIRNSVPSFALIPSSKRRH